MTRLRLSDLTPEQRERIKAVARIDHEPRRMNKTEARRADALEAMKRGCFIHDYRFEAMKLRLADGTFFTPDFLVIGTAGEVELEDVKGRKGDGYYSTEDARLKVKIAADQYPWFRFYVAWEDRRGNWCRKEVRPA